MGVSPSTRVYLVISRCITCTGTHSLVRLASSPGKGSAAKMMTFRGAYLAHPGAGLVQLPHLPDDLGFCECLYIKTTLFHPVSSYTISQSNIGLTLFI
ncbi:hypothetical protein FHS10_005843 [Mucilaginibacter dorajii]|nr:hypothetical protein [Mucilaginibacter dorajii]